LLLHPLLVLSVPLLLARLLGHLPHLPRLRRRARPPVLPAAATADHPAPALVGADDKRTDLPQQRKG